jgi:hypothetical protein
MTGWFKERPAIDPKSFASPKGNTCPVLLAIQYPLLDDVAAMETALPLSRPRASPNATLVPNTVTVPSPETNLYPVVCGIAGGITTGGITTTWLGNVTVVVPVVVVFDVTVVVVVGAAVVVVDEVDEVDVTGEVVVTGAAVVEVVA